MDLSQLADIALKLIVGMLGILAFLRTVGKGQLGQITPLDTVSAFVIGALVGGVAYNPDMTILHLIFAFAVWIIFNLFVRFCMRSALLRRWIKGTSDYLVKDGILNFKVFKRNSLEMEQFRVILRQKGIYSLFEVKDVLWEPNGAITVTNHEQMSHSFLIINNGAINEHNLKHCNRTPAWVMRNLKKYGFRSPSDLFCMEWTPKQGFYIVAKNGDVKRGPEEVLAEDILNAEQT